MSKLPDIEKQVRDACAHDHGIDPVGIMRAVVELGPNNAEYITLPLLVQLVNERHAAPLSTNAGDRDYLVAVYTVAQCLASEGIGLLDPHFELLRDDDTSAVLENDDVAEALKGGVLYDPDSGAVIPNWEDHVVPFFSATMLLKELMRDRG